MIAQTRLVESVQFVERVPLPPPPAKRSRGRPTYYPDRLFLQALVIMIVRQVTYRSMGCCKCWSRTRKKCSNCAI